MREVNLQAMPLAFVLCLAASCDQTQDAAADTEPLQDGAGTTVGTPGGCEYPIGAVDPMALNEVLWPYSWPRAIAADGTEVQLELADAPCGDDATMEWSAHDVLVFISIPAW